jgi:hypothetical protein
VEEVKTMSGRRSGDEVRCAFCGSRGSGNGLVEADVRGVRYDYCDAACAAAHRMAVELTAVLCADCDEDAAGDIGFCAEHLEVDAPDVLADPAAAWRRAG